MRLAGIAMAAAALLALTSMTAVAQVQGPGTLNPNIAPQGSMEGTYTANRPDFQSGATASNPDAWRMKYMNGTWWYWSPENRWMVFVNNQWVSYEQYAAMQGTATTGPSYTTYAPYSSSYDYYPSYGYPSYRYGSSSPYRSGYGSGYPGWGYGGSGVGVGVGFGWGGGRYGWGGYPSWGGYGSSGRGWGGGRR